jgi:hypothetical protein
MRSIKMLGLTALAALALTAGLGASSASATTTLCKTNTGGTGCASANRYPAGTVIKAQLATGTQAVIATSIGSIQCKTTSWQGSTSAQSGEPLLGKISGWAMANCSTPVWGGSASCTATPSGLPSALEIFWTAGSNGVLLPGGVGINLQCSSGFLTSCSYSFTAQEASFNLEGGSPATVRAVSVPLHRTAGSCPEEAKFSATFTVTSPNPLYVDHT